MNSLAATYEWRSSSVEPDDASLSPPLCDCLERSPAEQEVQELKAKAELALLRDRTRKACASWLGEPQSRKPTAAPIRIEWHIGPADLIRQLCHWKHTSALSLVGMTPCLAELTRQHRRLEGSSPEPPASKNKLTLTVWNLAATVQAKLQQWRGCVEAVTEDEFNGVIAVRTSDLVPIWMWEADCLRHRPALTSVCNRMLSMELFQYRRGCDQLTQLERQQVSHDQEPLFTPFGLRWPRGASDALSSPPPPAPRTSPSIRSRSKKVFAGETFCFSGAFSITREAMLELIRNNGGTIAKSVTRSCTYLVAESVGSAKTRKAQAAGIPIVTEQWVHTSMATGKKSTDPSLFVARSSSSDDDDRNALEEQPEVARPATSKRFTARLAQGASRRPTRVSLSGTTAARSRPSVVASRRNVAHNVSSSLHRKGNADPHRSRGVIMISTNRRYDAPHISEHLQNEDDDDDEAATHASDDSEEEIGSDDSEADRSSNREDTSSDDQGEEPTSDTTSKKLKKIHT